jgi:hypothetical protein
MEMEFSPSISSKVSMKTPDADLERSVLLLDDALRPAGKSLLRVSRNTPQRRAVGTRRRG